MDSERRKALCFLCYKKSISKPKNIDSIHCDDEASGDKDNISKLTTKFVRFFSRYLNVGLSNEDQKVLTEFLSPCDSCFNLIQEFCNLYKSLEILKLQLKAKVGTIYETITHSGRVPARVHAFRKQFEVQNKSGSSKIKEKDGRQVRNQIEKLRKKFIKNYQVKVKKCSEPRVILERIQNPRIPTEIQTGIENEMEEPETLKVQVEERMEITIEPELVIKYEEAQNESAGERDLHQAQFNFDNSQPQPILSAQSSSPELLKLRPKRVPTCKICLCRFKHPMDLRRHMKEMHNQFQNNVPLMCCYCSLTFEGHNAIRGFRTHMNNIHKLPSGLPGTFECTVCHEKFARVLGYRTHMEKVHNPNLLCEICQKYFESEAKLGIHKNCCNQEIEERTCHLCGIVCNDEMAFKEHLEIGCISGPRKSQELEKTSEDIELKEFSRIDDEQVEFVLPD